MIGSKEKRKKGERRASASEDAKQLVLALVDQAMRERRELLESLRCGAVSDALLKHDLDQPLTRGDLQAVLLAIGRQRPVSWQLAYRLVAHLIAVTSGERIAGLPRCA